MNTELILLACVGLCFPQAASRFDEASEIRHQASGTAWNRVRGGSRYTPSEKRSSSRRSVQAWDRFVSQKRSQAGLVPDAWCLMPLLAGNLLKGTD